MTQRKRQSFVLLTIKRGIHRWPVGCPNNRSVMQQAFACHDDIMYHVIYRTVHYCDVVTGAMASQITGLTIVYSTVYSSTDQRKYQSSASLAGDWLIPRTKSQCSILQVSAQMLTRGGDLKSLNLLWRFLFSTHIHSSRWLLPPCLYQTKMP